VLVDVPMDVFSSPLPIDAFSKVPAEIAPPSIDEATAERIVAALAEAERPVLYAAAACSRRARPKSSGAGRGARGPDRAHADGQGRRARGSSAAARHDRLLGHADRQREVPDGGRDPRGRHALAEANSSSWDPRFTFDIPPTRLIHIDADVAEIGRNFPTELGVVADAKLALGTLAKIAQGMKPPSRGALRADIAAGRRSFAANWADHYSSNQYPMRPERILSELRKAVPEDGYIVTDVGWNKNGVGQQFPITVPGTFITPSGLATMGFGPAAALGVKMAQPDRVVVALIGDGAFGSNPSVVATAMEAGLGVIWLVMDNAAFGTIAGLTNMHYGWEFGCLFEADGARYRTDFAQMAKGYGADGVFIRSADELGPALHAAIASGRPTVIQAPMENAPTPTPGHWDINCIYKKGS
jgi:acetolactate synthase-1/2/3 large subunit